MTKIINKNLSVVLVSFFVVAVVAVINCCMGGTADASTESNSHTYTCDPSNRATLDTSDADLVGENDTTHYCDGEEYVYDMHLGIDKATGHGATLKINYGAQTGGIFSTTDIDGWIVAVGRDGNEKAKFHTSENQYLHGGGINEEVGQGDCYWGDEEIAHHPDQFDGYFYIDKVKVDN